MKQNLARLNKAEDKAWIAYYNWFRDNRTDNRPSRCDKYAWDMVVNEFPRLAKYDGCLP